MWLYWIQKCGYNNRACQASFWKICAKSQVGFNDLIEATLLIKAGGALTPYPHAHPPQAACYISRPQRWRKWAKMPWNSAFKSLTLGWGHSEAIHCWEGSAQVCDHVMYHAAAVDQYRSSPWKGHCGTSIASSNLQVSHRRIRGGGQRL